MPLYKAFFIFCGGIFTGIVMDLPLLYPPLLKYLESIRSVSVVWGICNAPATLFAFFWTQNLQMPPRGEVAWVVVPAVTIPLQWIFISLIVIVVWALWSRFMR